MTTRRAANPGAPAQGHIRNYTRAMKNAKYLQRFAPHVLGAEEPPEGFASIIPAQTLAKLHRLRHDAPELSAHPALAEFLRSNALPIPDRPSRTPLFSGVFHFVQVTFQTPGGNLVFSTADMNMMVQYARHAIVPISESALVYGPNTPSVSSTVLTYSVNLPSASFNDSTLQGWVNDIASTNSLPTSDCVVVPTPQGLTVASVGGNSGYHLIANLPYIVFGVYAQNLTLQDVPDVYAMVISHEMGEVVVDPQADWSVGEVGDPCDENCLGANFYRAYFDAFDNYLGTNKQTPPGGFSFSYYICPVVKPDGIAHSPSDCHATDADCNYPPVPQDFYFTVDKSTFGRNEVQDNPSYPNAFWLILEGFTPNGVAASRPALSGNFQTDITGLTITPGSPTYELGNDPANADTPQRIRFGYDLQFTNASLGAFPASGAGPLQKLLSATLTVQGQQLQFNPATIFVLVSGADPYFTNVDPAQNNVFYLSQDLRVFTATPAGNNTPVAGGPAFGADSVAGAFSYIQALLTYLNGNFNNTGGADPFNSILPSQAGALTGDSSVTPFTVTPSFPPSLQNNYNFAVARVRLRGTAGMAGQAQNVKVFFRLWSSQTADTDYQPSTTYLSNLDGNNLPASPQVGSGNTTIPFFATGNNAGSSDYAAGGANNQTIRITTGDSIWAYFGCFLNLYDASNVVNGQPIQQLLNGTHHCLVAQIAYDDAPIVNAGGVTESPENSDKLAQRNLQVTVSDNPGPATTHRIPQMFDTRPSPALAAHPGNLLDYPDELMIDWGNTPAGSTASIFWPQVSAAQVLQLAAQLYQSHLLSAADTNTVQMKVTGGVTYVPIPAGTGENFAGLLTVDLPPTIVQGQEFNIVVRRLTTRRRQVEKVGRAGSELAVSLKGLRNWRYVVGTFQVKIPVSNGDQMLLPEENTLAIMKARLQAMPFSNRWRRVLVQYIELLSARVDGLGGDAGLVEPSFQGVPLKTLGTQDGKHEFTGKVCEIVYDCFGEFEGFVLDTCSSSKVFRSREKAIGELVLRALKERLLLSVYLENGREDRIFKLVIRC